MGSDNFSVTQIRENSLIKEVTISPSPKMLGKDDYKNDHSPGLNPKGKGLHKQSKRPFTVRKSGRSIEPSQQESERKIYKTDRQTSLQFNLARSRTIKVKGQGKNALRQDVIYKTVIRGLK